MCSGNESPLLSPSTSPKHIRRALSHQNSISPVQSSCFSFSSPSMSMSVSPPSTIPTSISRSPSPQMSSHSPQSHSSLPTPTHSSPEHLISSSPLVLMQSDDDENPTSSSPLLESEDDDDLFSEPVDDDYFMSFESPISSPTPSQSEILDPSSRANEFEPLFPGSPVTKGKGWELIMCFAITNRLSFNGISSLLNLLTLLCPAPNHLPPSFYLLSQYHNKHKNYKQKLYCSECNEEISHTDKTCKSVECKQKRAEVCEYVEVAFEAHLQQIYEG